MNWENASRGELEDEIYRLTDRVERAIVIAERMKENNEELLAANEQLLMQHTWLDSQVKYWQREVEKMDAECEDCACGDCAGEE